MDDYIIRLPYRGVRLLQNPLWNKGTAFTQEERDSLGLNGLLPPHVSTIQDQIKRVRAGFVRKKTPLGKYTYLLDLLNQNEHLFYQFVSQNPTETLPFIYTPTVGEASVQYSMIYTHPRGLYLSFPQKEKMEEMLGNYPEDEVQIVVATDGERILGLGDQGLGGITISIGKLALYTIFAGIPPSKTLPVILDVGTNNAQHLENDLYLGWRHRRQAGAEYDAFIELFVQTVKKRYPKALLQWEDFGKTNASRVLEKYRKSILSFNDDIQGTGAATLAALLSAIKISKERLYNQRVVIVGGGSAGIGIAKMILSAMMQDGLSREDALRRIFIVDAHGLLHSGFQHADENQVELLHPQEAIKGWTLENPQKVTLMELVSHAHPTALIGVCGQAGIFTKELIQEMAKHVKRPIVFPLSNPTSKAECTPSEVIEWTQMAAILATGSPFDPVEYLGRKIAIAQCNNVYIFPGLGLGALAAEAREITDTMFLEAANILANHSPALRDPEAALFPPLEEVRFVSRQIAIGVAKRALRDGVGITPERDIEAKVDSLIWTPRYPKIEPR